MTRKSLIILLLALLLGSVPLLVDEELFQLDERIRGSQVQLTQSIIGIFDHLEVKGITDPITAGQYSNVTVEAINSSGGLHCPYEETIHFTTTDPHPLVVLPGDYTFVKIADCGIHTFLNSIRLVTVGEQTVTVTEVGNPAVTASQTNITVLPGPVADISLAASVLTLTANGSDTSTITATLIDQFGNDVADGTTVTFSIESGSGSLSSNTATTTSGQAQVTYTAGTTSGTVTIKVLSGSVSETVNLTLNPGPATHLQVSGITDPITAGDSSDVVVTALDSNNNVATSYIGTVNFSSDCLNVTLPNNYNFQVSDFGTHTFSGKVALYTVGIYAVTAADVTHPSIVGSQTNIDVTAGQQTGIITASGHDGNVGDDITITSSVVKDATNNLVSGVTVTFNVTKSDSTVVTLTGTTNSSGIASVTLPGAQTNLAGAYSVTASASNMTTGVATTFTITSPITPPAATHFRVEGIIDPINAGQTSQVIVAALDSGNNVVTNYTGTITFTSDCTNTTLPGNYTFTGSDAGTHTFPGSVSFITTGVCAVIATDVTHPSITGGQTDIDVIAAQPTGIITASGHDGQIRDNITIASSKVADAYGNAAAGILVTFLITKPDSSIVSLTGITDAAGVATIIMSGSETSLEGVYSVTAAADYMTTGAATTFTISAVVTVPVAAHLEVKDIKDPITAGQSSKVTVIARDNSNNVVTDYSGTITFSSDCTNNILPGNYTFTASDSGTHTFFSSVIFYTTGVCSVTATDVTHSSITGSQTDIDVISGRQLGIITASGHDGQVGDNITISSSAVTDIYGNKVAGVTVTSYIFKPNGRAVILREETNELGIATAILSGEETDLVGDYRVTAYALNMITGKATTFKIIEELYGIPPPTITQPAYDGQIFDTEWITIKGIAVPEVKINVKIFLEDQLLYELITESDKRGNWQVDIPEALKNGQYKTTAKAIDQEGTASEWSDEVGFVVEAPVPPTTWQKIKEVWDNPDLPLLDKIKQTIKQSPDLLKELIELLRESLPHLVEITVFVLIVIFFLIGLILLLNSLLTWLDIPWWLWGSWLVIWALIKKKKRNYWGVVYDSHTKKPLARVLVKITNTLSGKVYRTISDSEGKYGFFVEQGTYGLSAKKLDYLFPSKYLQQHPKRGYPHSNTGAVVEVKSDRKTYLNVPLDDKNPAAKKIKNNLYHLALTILIVNSVLNFLSILIWPKASVLMIFVVQAGIIISLAIEKLKRKRYWGVVLDSQKKLPRDKANVIILDLSGQKVEKAINTNQVGFFFFNLKEGKYQVHVEEPGFQLFQLCLTVPEDKKKLLSLDIFLHQ